VANSNNASMVTDLLLSVFKFVFRKQPSPDPGSTITTVVYSRPGCHLCDEAVELLRGYGLQPETINIDTNPDLADRFGCCIPVVEMGGRIRFRGRVNQVLLRRLLKQS